MNQMGMRVNKPWKDDAAVEVNFACATRFRQAFDAAAWAHGGDAAVLDEKGAIDDDAGIGERATASRRGSAKRENL